MPLINLLRKNNQMKYEPLFCFSKEDGTALCVLSTKRKSYVGTATCSPTDQDMMSEKTGCEIAYRRALITALRSRRDELKIQIKALQTYYYTMNNSKYFEEDSYPIRRLKSHIDMLNDELAETKKLLKEEQNYLKKYMENKTEFYTKIRKNRQANT